MLKLKSVTAAMAAALILCGGVLACEVKADESGAAGEQRYTAEEMRNQVGNKGTLVTPGMSPGDYAAAAGGAWNEITFPENAESAGVNFSFDKVFSYSQWEKILFDLAKYENVRLFEIGETQGGRKIYSLEIGSAHKTVLLSAGVHAREIGGMYLLYQLLQEKAMEAGNSTEVHRSLTEDVKFAAIVAANPDGYEYYTETGKASVKSNNQYGDGKGIDINRSFPVSGGTFRLAGYKESSSPAGPAAADYPGPSLGCAKETQAMMRFFRKYISEENSAIAYIDFHQQGRVVYRSTRDSKVDDTFPNQQLGEKLVSYLGYPFEPYTASAGGYGGTTVRMAMDYSLGFQMGRFGVMGPPVQGEYLPLVLYRDLPDYRQYYPNKTSIPAITLEITRADYSKGAVRNVLDTKEEYSKYHFSGLLDYVADEAVKIVQ